jgi:hypothetical protein
MALKKISLVSGVVAAISLIVVAGFPGHGLASSATNGSRMTRSESRKLFLHIEVQKDSNGATGKFKNFLSTQDFVDEVNGSANVYDGVPNEAFIATGSREPAKTEFPSADGTPFRMNAKAHTTGLIAVRSFQAETVNDLAIPAGGGAATLELQLKGELSSGRKVDVGEQSIDYLVTPAQELYELDVDIAPAAGLHGKRFASITLTVLFRGAAVMSGAYELDDPASFIEVPVS